MGLFNLFKTGASDEAIKSMIEQGSPIVDVRSKVEFNLGNIEGSINIPLHEINDNIDKFKSMEGPIVLCCASGNRSGQAMRLLHSIGIECLNGGSWKHVSRYIT